MSLNELEESLGSLIAKILDIEESDVLIQDSPVGNIAPAYGVAKVYIKLFYEAGEVSRTKNTRKEYNEGTETFTFTQQSTKQLALKLVLYGTEADYNAELLFESIFTENIKLELSLLGLNFVSDKTAGPTTIWEPINSRWTKRCDLELWFYTGFEIEEVVNKFNEFDIRTEVN